MSADHLSSSSGAAASAAGLSLHRSSTGVRVALVGCGHGELDAMYSCVRHLQSSQGLVIDLLICCGDFQSVRNYSDLECMACPAKYRALNTFYKYYTGEATAPCMTIFIGGNHEASNYLVELSDTTQHGAAAAGRRRGAADGAADRRRGVGALISHPSAASRLACFPRSLPAVSTVVGSPPPSTTWVSPAWSTSAAFVSAACQASSMIAIYTKDIGSIHHSMEMP